MVIRLTPKASATSQSARLWPRSRGRTTTRKITADVTRRSQTMAVGGTTPKSCFAIAAPNWTETMPPTTSQTAGMRSSPARGAASSGRAEVTAPLFHNPRRPPPCRGSASVVVRATTGADNSGRGPGTANGQAPRGDLAVRQDEPQSFGVSVPSAKPLSKPSTMPPNSTGGASGALERSFPVKVNGSSAPGSATSTTTI